MESEEVRAPVVVNAPAEPSLREQAEHEALGHVQFRSWCRHCIRAKAAALPGHHPAPPEPETAVPSIFLDYCFMSGADGDSMAILAIKDHRTKHLWASTVEHKGADIYATNFLVVSIRSTGYRRIILRSDQEPAILALKAAARHAMPEVEMILQESPAGDHQANGSIEVAIRDLKRQIRVLLSDFEEKIG